LYFLGLLKLYGITISKDLTGAANAFEKAALLGNPDAQTAIGMMKMKSIGTSLLIYQLQRLRRLFLGIPEDFTGAIEMFRKAAEEGNGNGQWLLARSRNLWKTFLIFFSLHSLLYRMLIEGKGVRNDNLQQSYLEAFLHATKAADVHHIPQAEHLVGIIYEYGIGIPQDFTKAVTYYRRAAEQRYIESMYHLALMYVYGRGTDIQLPRGLSLFEAGCEANHAPSCHYMGIMKTYGYGTAVDYHEAVLWFEKSSSLDDHRISKESGGYAVILSDLIREAEDFNNKVVDQYMRRQEQYEDL
jgi:uncharacterized protein